MIRINLLPHRAAKRALRQREFNFILLGTLVGGRCALVCRQPISMTNRVAATPK